MGDDGLVLIVADLFVVGVASVGIILAATFIPLCFVVVAVVVEVEPPLVPVDEEEGVDDDAAPLAAIVRCVNKLSLFNKLLS